MSEQKDSGQGEASGAKSADSADAHSTSNPPNTSVINRRSRWASSLAALRYVNNVQRDEEIKVRDSDKATALALLFCLVGALVCLLVPGFEAHKLTFVVATDVLVGVSLLMYISNRFGILNTFLPRQALLTWQLMLGAAFVGIFVTMNFSFLINWLLRHNQSSLFGP